MDQPAASGGLPSDHPPRGARTAPWLVASFVVLVPLCLVLVWLVATHRPWERPQADAPALPEFEPLRLAPKEVLSHLASTDKGRPVQLIECARVAAEDFAAKDLSWLRRSPMSGYVIALHGDDLRCNCHGWVFAGGRYWIEPTEVDAILEDNDYRPVASPREGDLAIYRNAAGEPVHSGIVRIAGQGIPVLVESKWGERGHFLHPAGVHDFPGTVCTFYRSPRQGHILRGLPAERLQPGPLVYPGGEAR